MPCNRTPGTGNTVAGPFVNWAGNVIATPQQIFQPTTLDELVAIVKQAEAEDLSVHAVGTGWSFTDVMTATGYMVETVNLNGMPEPNINPPAGFKSPVPVAYGSTNVTNPIVPRKPLSTLSETMTGTQYLDDPIFGALTASALERNLVHVEAGIKIADLYTLLESISSGVTTPDGFWHGYAVKTLGGSGGQAITGAFTTSTHGGDDHDSQGPIRPLPDMVQGIRLVGPGGLEYFIQRGSSRAIVNSSLLASLDPCLAGPGQIITSDDVFNAVVVSIGRMGVIYSVVLEVQPQYFLKETVTNGRWKQLIPTISSLRESNRFLEIIILPYASWEQAQIGNNTTASTPFVVPDTNGAWVYFQGTDTEIFRGPGTLWKIRDDGTQQSKIGNNTTASAPFVEPDPNGGASWVYFQGTDNTLWKIRDDGTQQSQIGGNTTASTPFVVPDPNGGASWVYFQGTDNTLWKVRDDGTQQSQIGGNTTASTPFVVPDPNGGASWVYFMGTDTTLWKVRDDGTQQSQIGGNTTASTPFVVPDPNEGASWVYFMGTDTTLWKVRDDGTQQSRIGGNTTLATPCVMPDPNGGASWVYFMGTDTTLWKVRDDGTELTNLGGNTTASTPFVTTEGWVYFQGTDTAFNRGPGTLWKIRTDNDHTCIVTTRKEVPASQFVVSNSSPGIESQVFTYACEEAPTALSAQIALIIGGLAAFAAGTIPLLLLLNPA